MAAVTSTNNRGHGGFEVRSWLFVRISGLALVFLALGHMAIMHLIGGGVDRIDFDFVARRWEGALWRSYDWLLLATALLHGAAGARLTILDHIRHAGLRRGLLGLLAAATAVLLALGTFVIVKFQP
ncbi:MAG: succinate dehydrogenase [Actinomycetota bacterium]